MAELLRRGLSDEGHSVVLSLDGRQGLSLAESEPFDLLLLDAMLPGTDGFTIVRRLRGRQNQTPILMLTARDTTRDIVEGLNLGADDYMTKPFAFDELFARVRAAGRRGPAPHTVQLRIGNLTLDQGTREVRRGEREISLTRTEFALLEVLMRHSGRVVSRDTLIETVWGGQSDIESNTLDAFMRLLRGKVETPGEPKLVQTIRGVGFCLRTETK